MGEKMKEENNYLKGYMETNNTLDYKKYGLLNDYGLNLDRCNKCYNEENIIKKKCNITKNSGK